MTTGLDARDPFPARSFEQPSRQEASAWWPADQTSRREDRNVTSARSRQSLAEAVSFRHQRHKSSICRAAPARWHTWALARSRWIRGSTCVTTNNSDGHDSPPEANDRIVRPRRSKIRELSNRTRACRSSRAQLPLRHREHVAQPRAPDEARAMGRERARYWMTRWPVICPRATCSNACLACGRIRRPVILVTIRRSTP